MIKGSGEYTGNNINTGVVLGDIPPYPGAGILKSIFIPPPPLLEKGLSDIEIAEKLAAAYRGAVAAVYGKKCFVLMRGDIRAAKQFSSLVVAGDFLRQLNVAPISWAHWSVKVWFNWKRGKSNPPVHWVYAVTRLDQKLVEFRSAHHSSTPKVALTPTHKRLLSIYNGMVTDLNSLSSKNCKQQQQSIVVAKHFPSGLYKRLVSRVNVEVASIQERINTRVERGEWIWNNKI